MRKPCISLLLGLLLGPAAAEPVPLTMYYFERPPLYYSEEGRIAGFYAAPVVEAAARAGIPLRWEASPSSLLFPRFKDNQEAFCSPGWGKTEERLRWAQFSVPYLTPPKFAVVTRVDLVPELKRIGSLHALLARKDLVLGRRKNFSLGTSLDALIAKYRPPQRIQHLTDPEYYLQYLASRHFDYSFGIPAVLEYLRTYSPAKMDGLDIVNYKDIPTNEPLRLMCSRKTPADLLDRFNAALAKADPTPR